MPEPDAELVEWAAGDYPEVIDPETLLPTSWSEQPRRDDAGRDAQAALGFEADVPTPAEAANAYVELLRLWAIWARDEPGRGRFGDGSDGDTTIGVGTTTLTGPLYAENLVVTGTLETRGYPVYVRGTLSGAGTIFAGGGDASGTSGGSVAAGSTAWGRGGAGGNGDDPGFAGTGRTNSLGGDGGAGGNGGGAELGGAAGTATDPAASLGGTDVWRTLDQLITGRTPDGAIVTGGGGGGGGGGSGGGGGGAGADVLALFVHNWQFTGTIDLRGGDGADASSSDHGGGGSGGGGVLAAALRRGDWELSGAGPHTLAVTVAGQSYACTVDVRAGVPGQGDASGFDGAAGTAGTIWIARG